jgi:hypothetical protein
VSGEESQKDSRTRTPGVYIEDAVTLVSIGLLFWLGVFRRHETSGQIALGVVLLVMVIVLVRRVRRLHRAFREEP